MKDYNEGNPSARSILGYFEIHIIPVLNPDGYEYTFTVSGISPAKPGWSDNASV